MYDNGNCNNAESVPNRFINYKLLKFELKWFYFLENWLN